MDYKYNKLRGRIIEKYGSLNNFAMALGNSQTTISLKMNGHIGFSQGDIERWAKLLGIPFNEYPLYFFT